MASIQDVIEAAFPVEESKIIAELAAELCRDVTRPAIKSLVAEREDKLVGYVSFSPIYLASGTDASGYILSPLAVSPEFQKQGVGSSLIKRGTDLLAEDGVGVLLVYGDPSYYGRFGFKEEVGRSFVPPYPLAYPFGWTGMMLNDAKAPNSPTKFECVAALSKADLW